MKSGPLAIYGWTGSKTSSHIEGGQTTVAERIDQNFLRQGLAEDFLEVIMVQSALRYQASGFWAELWESNIGSRKTAKHLGFEVVDKLAGERVTPRGEVDDVRLFALLPENVLEQMIEKN